MTGKWVDGYGEEMLKLQVQIELAKEKWKEIHWKVHTAEYWWSTKDLLLIFELKEQHKVAGRRYYTDYGVDIKDLSCLRGKTEDEISKVSILGERAIQWEELDIQIGLDDILMSVQLRENWLYSLK